MGVGGYVMEVPRALPVGLHFTERSKLFNKGAEFSCPDSYFFLFLSANNPCGFRLNMIILEQKSKVLKEEGIRWAFIR